MRETLLSEILHIIKLEDVEYMYFRETLLSEILLIIKLGRMVSISGRHYYLRFFLLLNWGVCFRLNNII